MKRLLLLITLVVLVAGCVESPEAASPAPASAPAAQPTPEPPAAQPTPELPAADPEGTIAAKTTHITIVVNEGNATRAVSDEAEFTNLYAEEYDVACYFEKNEFFRKSSIPFLGRSFTLSSSEHDFFLGDTRPISISIPSGESAFLAISAQAVYGAFNTDAIKGTYTDTLQCDFMKSDSKDEWEKLTTIQVEVIIV